MSNTKVKMVKATFNPSANTSQRTIATHSLGVFIPQSAVILRAFYDVVTTFTSATDAATIALQSEGANDIVSAIAISDASNPWDAGNHAGLPQPALSVFHASNNPTAVQMQDVVGDSLISVGTTAKELKAVVAVEALTAGKLNLFVEYVISE